MNISPEVVTIEKLHRSWAGLRSQVPVVDDRLAQMPIRVVPSEKEAGCFEVVDGFKRLRAAREAGIRQLPVVVEDARGPQAKGLLLRANAPRRTLSPMDEARGVKSLVDEDGLTLTAAAKLLGKKRPWTSKRYALAQRLARPLEKAVDEGRLSLTVAYALTGFVKDQPLPLAHAMFQAGLSAANALALLSTYRALETDAQCQALLRDPLGTLDELSQARPETVLALSSPAARKLERYRQLSKLLDEFRADVLPGNISPAEARLLEAERKVIQAKIISAAQALCGVSAQSPTTQVQGTVAPPKTDRPTRPTAAIVSILPQPCEQDGHRQEAPPATDPNQPARTAAAATTTTAPPPDRSPGTPPTRDASVPSPADRPARGLSTSPTRPAGTQTGTQARRQPQDPAPEPPQPKAERKVIQAKSILGAQTLGPVGPRGASTQGQGTVTRKGIHQATMPIARIVAIPQPACDPAENRQESHPATEPSQPPRTAATAPTSDRSPGTLPTEDPSSPSRADRPVPRRSASPNRPAATQTRPASAANAHRNDTQTTTTTGGTDHGPRDHSRDPAPLQRPRPG